MTDATKQIDIQALAAQFNVDPGAFKCLLVFLKNKLTEPEAAQAFANASPAKQEEFITAGVKAWHAQSVAVLSELHAGTSEWAQAARQQIAHDVWTQARANK